MFEIGTLAFASPWLLYGLVLLPTILWILMISPPPPRLLQFPAVRLLFDLRQSEETPARTPLWLLIFRMILAALVILALAHPLLNPATRLGGSGPLVLVIDDGWAAARNWSMRRAAIDGLTEEAKRIDRQIFLLTTAPPADGEPIRLSGRLRADQARALALALQPKPWPVDRAAARAAIDGLALEGSANVVWLSDGVNDEHAAALARELHRHGTLRLIEDAPGAAARLVLPPIRDERGLRVDVARVRSTAPDALWLRATGADGRVIARQSVRMAAGETRAGTDFRLPIELLNEIVTVQIEGEAGAGAVVLLDEGWRRRPVGLVGSESFRSGHPLLNDQYYLERALAPYAALKQGTVGDLLRRRLAVIAVSDSYALSPEESRLLTDWIAQGGLLLRFAGPRLAETEDDLLPVRLRRGGRVLGGSLTWARPMPLAPFAAASPFAGLAVPGDVTVSRQVLAEPDLTLPHKTWATLTDGTPLVTAERRDRGWLVLIHTTASADWSNLPLSGLFVEMLRRLVTVSQGVSGVDSEGDLPPLQTLDGFGRLVAPGVAVRPVAADKIAETVPGPTHPPGFYGTENGRRAFNLSAAIAVPVPLGAMPPGVVRTGYAAGEEIDLKPWMLLLAALLALVDLIISLTLQGHLTALGNVLRARHRATFSLVALAAVFLTGPAGAAETAADRFALEATLETRLAYVRTGLTGIDETSRMGLQGLGSMLQRRTAVEPAPPIEVDIESDEIAFFPLLYWPVASQQPAISDRARGKVADYLRNGGTILFDTRDQVAVPGTLGGMATGAGPGMERLRALLHGLNLPPLVPVPPDHVLTKAFYLLQEFPGRWTGGTLWIEQPGHSVNDGVSSVIIGGHDWAGAWAVNTAGRPLFAVVPGGETQREAAYRFGINLVMYALTGNYKADQVHVPAILQRLGQ